jgi:hypothetical protein
MTDACGRGSDEPLENGEEAAEAPERVHADPFWNDHTGTDLQAAEMALKQAAKKQLGLAE